MVLRQHWAGMTISCRRSTTTSRRFGTVPFSYVINYSKHYLWMTSASPTWSPRHDFFDGGACIEDYGEQHLSILP